MLPDLSGLAVHDVSPVGGKPKKSAKSPVTNSRGITKPMGALRPLALQAQESDKPPIAILMLCKYHEGPPNLAVWNKWLHETGRPGSRLFIHGKKYADGTSAPWSVASIQQEDGGFGYASVMQRMGTNNEKPTEWGGASLVDATIELMEEATHYATKYDVNFTHYALVSSDTVPLKPLSEVECVTTNGVATSTFAPYDDFQHQKQRSLMAKALAVWQAPGSGLAGNYWATKIYDHMAIGFPVCSQFWIMSKQDVVHLLEQDMIFGMAEAYDKFFEAYKQVKGEDLEPFAADEVVFMQALLVDDSNPNPAPVTNKVMAEKQEGKHAIVHDSVPELRRDCAGSYAASFGRKITRKLPPTEMVTWM